MRDGARKGCYRNFHYLGTGCITASKMRDCEHGADLRGSLGVSTGSALDDRRLFSEPLAESASAEQPVYRGGDASGFAAVSLGRVFRISSLWEQSP